MDITQLGPYRIGKRLGRGGMGTVYEGVDVDAKSPAAIKILSPSLAHDEGFRERFIAEIESLKKLRHPNIVRLFGWGEQDGHLFYAMELVTGGNLEQELQAGRRFDWREVTSLSIRLAKALKHAHDSGVIHRDIKPANLMLTEAREVKLSDFGIARLFGSVRLTVDGGVIGTAEYMSPEQADGRPVTARCDLYSLGSVMFALLVGRPPFVSRSLPEMLQLQRFAAPEPVRKFVPDVPEELEQIILQLLEKDPEQRIPSAMLLGRRLEAMEYGLGVRQPRKSDGWSDTVADDGFEVGPQTDSEGEYALADDGGETKVPHSPLGNLVGPDAPTAADPMLPLRSSPTDADLAATIATPSTRKQARQETEAQNLSFAVGAATPPQSPVSAQPAPARFTTVLEAERAAAEAEREAGSSRWLQVGIIVAALLILAGIVWYASRPSSANSLYETISKQATSQSPDGLADVHPQMQEFLERFPGDPRASEVREYLEEVELERTERRLRRRIEQQALKGDLTPLEYSYFDAISMAQRDPPLAVAKLEALLTLYTSQQVQDGFSQQLLDSARQQLERLRPQARQFIMTESTMLDTQLARANDLRSTSPEESRAIWQAIISLFSDKPWAAVHVETARQALAETAPK